MSSLSVAGVQGQNINPPSLLRSASFHGAQNNGSPSGVGFASLTSPRSSYGADLAALGAGAGAGYNGLNQGLSAGITGHASSNGTVAVSRSHVPNAGLGAAPSVSQRSLSVGSEAHSTFGGSGMPASPLSFTSNNVPNPGISVNSLARHSSATILDQQQQELQQLQQQVALSNPQISQDSQVLQHQHLEQLQQQQQHQNHLHHHQQQQQQQIGLSHLRGQQVFGMGAQQQMYALAPMKMGQQQLNSLQSAGAVKLESRIGSPLRSQLQQQSVQTLPHAPKLEPMDAPLRQQLHQLQKNQPLQAATPMKIDQQLAIPKMEVKPELDISNAMVQQSLIASHLHQQEALQRQMNLLQQQKFLYHHQRTQLQQQQLQHHLRQQLAGPPKQLFEPGVCSRRLMQYIFNQRQRPQDNNIHFWRRFVAEFFAHGARKRWCVSQYGNNGRQPTGVFPQDVWHCEICGSRPGRGFETTMEVLPRLCKIKYDSGILDELLFVDISNEYRLGSGHMVLEYGKAVQESIFEHLRVVREGQLRIIFTSELKILLWEFCARGHEELLPRKLLVPQVAQVAAMAQKYQNLIVNQNQNGSSNISIQDLQSNCQLVVSAARQLTRTLEAPTVNDLGYTKRYVRCLQISEVVNSMKDLIDFSQENRIGPIESLRMFPRRTVTVGGLSSEMLRERIGSQVLPPEQNVGQAGSANTGANHSNLSSSATLTRNANSVSAYPGLSHQNSVQSTVQLQNNDSNSLILDANASGGLASSSITSSNLTQVSSLQNCQTSGSESSANTFFNSAQVNSQNGAIALVQQPSRQPNRHENPMTAQQLQELMIQSQLKSGTSYQQHQRQQPQPQHQHQHQHQQQQQQQQQQLATATTGVDMKVGMNAGLVSGSGNAMMGANGFRNLSNANEALTGNGGHGICSSSDNDSGNIGGVSSSFSDGLLSQSYLSAANDNNVMGLGSDNLMGGPLHSASLIADEQSFLQDPSHGFAYDFGGNDLFPWNS